MSTHAQQAQTLVEALPYIQKYTGKTVVIKYGGNAMISEDLRKAVMSDIILLNLVGIRVVVVHGGGPEISDMLKKIGHTSHFVDGLRYTDEVTMDIVQSVLCGKVNKNLVAQLNRLGGQAIGLCGMDGQLFQATLLDEKYGLVGEIQDVNPDPVNNALLSGYIPVVSTVAQGVDVDTAYNINAEACLGCGLCEDTCPRHLITMISPKSKFAVICNNKDKGATARKVCQSACIGCKKCERLCPEQAITVTNNLARIDHSKCKSCGLCEDNCPTGALKRL